MFPKEKKKEYKTRQILVVKKFLVVTNSTMPSCPVATSNPCVFRYFIYRYFNCFQLVEGFTFG